MSPASPRFPLPAALQGKCSQADYTHWLYGKAAAHVRRDRKRGNDSATTDTYREAIHAAVSDGGDRDAYTGEPLDWGLIRTYDNDKSKQGRRDYKKSFALLPTVDHVDDGLGHPDFKICSWRTNDCKNDLTIAELTDFSRTFLAYQEQHNESEAPMTDGQLISDFTRIDRSPDAVQVMVADISWPSPSQPETTWHAVANLPADATDEETSAAQNRALADIRYFATCRTCREKQPAGWMHDESICQSCASRDLGIVY